jgi:hypothetical protein
VSRPEAITSVRQAAAACSVTPPVIRRWISLGLIPQPPWTLGLALVERGQCYLAEGKRAMVRKDFQKVLAENANYSGLADHLVAVGE